MEPTEPMPRYFFHAQIDGEIVPDPDGRELADADAAWEAARVLALQLLQGAANDPALLQAVLVVADDRSEVVLEFPLTEALAAEPPTRSDAGTRH